MPSPSARRPRTVPGSDGVPEQRRGPGHVGLGVDGPAAGVEEPLPRPRAEERQRRPHARAVQHLVRQAGRGQPRGVVPRIAHQQGALAPQQRDAEPLLGGAPRQAAPPRQLHPLGRVGDVTEDPPRPAGLARARAARARPRRPPAPRSAAARAVARPIAPAPTTARSALTPAAAPRVPGGHFSSSASCRRRRSVVLVPWQVGRPGGRRPAVAPEHAVPGRP